MLQGPARRGLCFAAAFHAATFHAATFLWINLWNSLGNLQGKPDIFPLPGTVLF